MDIIFVSPNNSSNIYQSLSSNLSAIEPPTWALILAESCRNNGFNVGIVDTLAENLSDQELVSRIKTLEPRLICFVAYGQNVNAGTTSMSGVSRQSSALKNAGLSTPISVVGSHVQALPKETLEKEKSIDIVFLGEGIYPLLQLLNLKKIVSENFNKVDGIAYKFGNKIFFSSASHIVSKDRMDLDMPGYAWDLLPYKNKPFDLYRSPLWHADYIEKFRSPYVAIQTSIGCQFKCSFCMINLINKNDVLEEGVANNYNGMRHWSVEFVKNEFEKIINMGVSTIRITDEMFFLNKKYYRPIIQYLKNINTDDKLRIWAYSRIDTVPDPETLKDIRAAGFRWICLGIESGDQKIRLEISKGKFQEVDVRKVVHQIENAGINVLANYIYGLPGDDNDTIEKTYQLSVELNTLGWNTYAAMALPGSPLYKEAKENGMQLPKEYDEFSFHSYNCIPLSTDKMPAHEILRRRDNNFHRYFERPEFLDRLSKKFGLHAKENVKKMLQKKLKRKIIEVADRLQNNNVT